MSLFEGRKRYGSVYRHGYGYSLPEDTDEVLQEELGTNPPSDGSESSFDDASSSSAYSTADGFADEPDAEGEGDREKPPAPPPPPPLPAPIVAVNLRFGQILKPASAVSNAASPVHRQSPVPPPAVPLSRSVTRLRAKPKQAHGMHLVLDDIHRYGSREEEKSEAAGYTEEAFFAYTDVTAAPILPVEPSALMDVPNSSVTIPDALDLAFAPKKPSKEADVTENVTEDAGAGGCLRQSFRELRVSTGVVAPTGPVQVSSGYSGYVAASETGGHPAGGSLRASVGLAPTGPVQLPSGYCQEEGVLEAMLLDGVGLEGIEEEGAGAYGTEADLAVEGGAQAYGDLEEGERHGIAVLEGGSGRLSMAEIVRSVVNIKDAELLKRLILGSLAEAEQLRDSMDEVVEGDVQFNVAKFTSRLQQGPTALRSRRHDRNWNSEFQALQETPDSEEKFTSLSRLAHDFVYAATTYAKIIISEVCVPDREKTIMPVDVGGVAGGKKYVCQNILFKFALDVQVAEGVWMYGGDEPSDENAMKAAAHELKGLNHYYSTHVSGLRYPLLAYIDYKGFRMIAISVLPIARGSIRYGSCDSGAFVHDDEPELTEMLTEAGEILNLQSHVTGTCRQTAKELNSCGDLEGHLGTDGNFYVLDFARAFPPEAPPKHHKEPRAVYYKLLRPETVRSHEQPLSADAYTSWGILDPRFREYNKEVLKATVKLLFKTVPAFAARLDARWAEIGDRLLPELHRAGINIRHMGQVRAACKVKEARDLLLLEMVVRVVKNHVRERMRRTMRQVRGLSQEPFKAEVIRVFNLILCTTDPQRPVVHDSDSLWETVKERVRQKFGNGFTKQCGLTEEEEAFSANLRDFVPMQLLFTRLNTTLGVRITEQAMEQLMEDPGSFEFVDADIEEVYAKPRFMDIIDNSEAMALEKMASRKTGREKLRLLELAGRKFDSALRSTPGSFLTLYHWGKVLVLQAKASFIYADRIRLLTAACDKFRNVMHINSAHPESVLHCAEAHLTIAMLLTGSRSASHFAVAAEMFSRLLQLDTAYLPLVQRYAYSVRATPSRVRLQGSIELCKCILEVVRCDAVALSLWAVNVEVLVSSFDEYSTESSLGAEQATFSQAVGTAVIRDYSLIPLVTRIGFGMKEKARSNKVLFAFAGEIFKALVTIESSSQLMLEWSHCLWAFALTIEVGSYRTALQSAAVKFDCVLQDDPSCMDDEVAASVAGQRRRLVNLVELAQFSICIRETLARHLAEVTSLCLGWSNLTESSAALLASLTPKLTSLDISHHNHCFPLLQHFLKHCPSLQSLNASCCPDLTAQEVFRCAEVWTSLQALNVADCKRMTGDVIDCLRLLPDLHSINIQSCGMKTYLAADPLALGRLAHSCPQLRELNLNHCKMTDANVLPMYACTGLEVLRMSYCTRVEQVGPWLSHLPSLRVLDVSNAYRSTDEIIVDATKHCTSLLELHVNNCKKLTDFGLQQVEILLSYALEKLEAENCFRISDEGIFRLARSSSVQRLVHLSLAHNIGLHEPALRALLSSLPHLRVLNVSKCNLTGDTLNALPGGEDGLPLEELTAARCPGISSVSAFMARAVNLRRVNLRLTNITDECLKAMSDNCRQLEAVEIAECTAVTDDGAVTLATLPLKELNVGSCHRITDELIAYLVAYCSSLESLDLSNDVKVSDELLGRLHHLPKLTSLNLAGCVRVKNSAIIRLAQHAPYLQHLNLSRTKLINDEAVLFLSKHCHSLQTLIASECALLKGVAVQWVTENRPNITMVNKAGSGVISELRGHRHFLGKPGSRPTPRRR